MNPELRDDDDEHEHRKNMTVIICASHPMGVEEVLLLNFLPTFVKEMPGVGMTVEFSPPRTVGTSPPWVGRADGEPVGANPLELRRVPFPAPICSGTR